MHICAAWLLKHVYHIDLRTEAMGFYERAVQLDPNFALAWARLSRAHAFLYSQGVDTTPPTRRDAAKGALENAQRLEPHSPETLLALGYYQYLVLGDYGLAKTTFKELSKLLPGNSEIPAALAHVAQSGGHERVVRMQPLHEAIAYFEQGLALDPRNVDLLVGAAATYATSRQFPVAIKLYDRALAVIPNDPELMAFKAAMYQAEGNLPESAKLLIDVNERTTSGIALQKKLNQLRLERNHAEAIRLLQARRAQGPSAFEMETDVSSEFEVNILYLFELALAQRFVGDMAGAKVTAEQVRNAAGAALQEQPDNPDPEMQLALADALIGDRDSALREEERANMRSPRPEYHAVGPPYDDVLALIQTVLGENSRAISTLTRLLQTPYNSYFYDAPVTPALLRLDPIWDPLRGDPAFQKLCEEKQP